MHEALAKEAEDAIDKMSRTLLDSVEASLHLLERRVDSLETTKNAICLRLRNTEAALEEERSEKRLLSTWLDSFVVNQHAAVELDAVDFAFARYALSLAIAAPQASQERLIEAGVPTFLVGVVKASKKDLVCGPALLALTHVSFGIGPMRKAIAGAGGPAALVERVRTGRRPPMLTHACRALSVLALDSSVRSNIVAIGGINALVDLLAHANLRSSSEDRFTAELQDEEAPQLVTETVQEAALGALTHLAMESAAYRQLATEYGCAQPAVECLLFARDGGTVLNAALLLANLEYQSAVSAARCLRARSDTALCAVIEACDEAEVVSACFRALANCAVDESARVALSATNAPDICFSAIEKSTHHDVLGEAADCATAMSYMCLASKLRFAQLGAFRVICRTLEEYEESSESSEVMLAFARLNATLLALKANHLLFRDADGLEIFSHFCLATENLELLRAVAMSIASVAPTPFERWEAMREEHKCSFEQTPDALRALRRCSMWCGRASPDWLEGALASLTKSRGELERSVASTRSQSETHVQGTELFPAEDVYKEVQCPLILDHVVSRSPCLNNLTFSVY